MRLATAVAAAVFFALGVVVVRLQEGRDPSALRTLSYAMAAAYLTGSVLCLTLRRRLVLVGAALVSAATLVPTHFTLAFPLVIPLWVYALSSSKDSPRSSVDDHEGSSPGAVKRT